MRQLIRRQAGALVGSTLVAIALSAGAALAQSRELWMNHADSAAVTGYFLAGERIWGSCDGDCLDLDIQLLDADGELVDQDVEMDANPVVVAPAEGPYTLVISLPHCSTSAGCAVWLDSDHGF